MARCTRLPALPESFLNDLKLWDWIWTSVDLYPNVYKSRFNEGWYGYNRGGAPSKRWCFRLNTQKWMTEEDLLPGYFA